MFLLIRAWPWKRDLLEYVWCYTCISATQIFFIQLQSWIPVAVTLVKMAGLVWMDWSGMIVFALGASVESTAKTVESNQCFYFISNSFHLSFSSSSTGDIFYVLTDPIRYIWALCDLTWVLNGSISKYLHIHALI